MIIQDEKKAESNPGFNLLYFYFLPTNLAQIYTTKLEKPYTNDLEQVFPIHLEQVFTQPTNLFGVVPYFLKTIYTRRCFIYLIILKIINKYQRNRIGHHHQNHIHRYSKKPFQGTYLPLFLQHAYQISYKVALFYNGRYQVLSFLLDFLL